MTTARAQEIDLLPNATTSVDRTKRLARRRALTESQRAELHRFEGEYFDGPTGYGGYHYDGRHAPVVRKMIERYGLNGSSRVLDIGCAKGFMLCEFVKLGIGNAHGCDISRYAVDHGHPLVRDHLRVISADTLDYADESFDFVYSIDAIHNLPPEACDQAIREVARVSRGGSFIQVASFQTTEQEQALRDWGVTVRTLRTMQAWREAFDCVGYRGDYGFKTFLANSR